MGGGSGGYRKQWKVDGQVGPTTRRSMARRPPRLRRAKTQSSPRLITQPHQASEKSAEANAEPDQTCEESAKPRTGSQRASEVLFLPSWFRRGTGWLKERPHFLQ